MRALFYRYGSICEPDIIEGFKELGIEVLEIDIEIYDKSILPAKTIRVVNEFLQNNAVDFVFSINFFPAISDLCNIYHIRYFSWSVDCPVLELYTKAICNEWNRTFLFDKAQYNDLVEYNPDRIFHLPLAANPEKMQERIYAFGDFENNRWTNSKNPLDVSFVGSLYSEKCPYDMIKGLSDYSKGFLEAVINAQENIYGSFIVDELLLDSIVNEIKESATDFDRLNGYEHFLSDRTMASHFYIASKITANERKHLLKLLSENADTHIFTASDTRELAGLHNHGTCNTISEMPVVFYNTKVNIATTSKAIRSGIPLRVFDILSCGGFVLSNYQPEIAEVFTPGQDLLVYSSMEECVELVNYYLSHESERKEISINGLETVKKNHTYKARLAKMITTGFEI